MFFFVIESSFAIESCGRKKIAHLYCLFRGKEELLRNFTCMRKNRGRELVPPLQKLVPKPLHDETMGEKTVAVDLALVLEI